MLRLVATDFPFQLEILVAIVVAIGFGALLYAARWVGQRRMESRAQTWTRVDATVYDSYEIDEKACGTTANIWRRLQDPEVSRWAVAIQYSYCFGGKVHVGIYFLPETWSDGYVAAEAGRSWIGKQIVIRCSHERPEQSLFLVGDGAPGRPHIPASFAEKPYITTLSLK